MVGLGMNLPRILGREIPIGNSLVFLLSHMTDTNLSHQVSQPKWLWSKCCESQLHAV